MNRRRPSHKQRLSYAVDLILGKGLWGVLFLAVLGTLLLLTVVVPVLLGLRMVLTHQGSWSQLPYLIWSNFARVFKLGEVEGPWIEQLGSVLVALIGIFFTGIVFGILVRSLADKLRTLRETGNQIVADHHTVILGWSGIGETVVEQLAVANENKPKATVAVLDSKSKVVNEESARGLDTRNMRIHFRRGSLIKPADFDIVRVDLADRVIVMGNWGAEDYDEQIVTQLLALSRYRDRHPQWNATVVAPIKEWRNHATALVAADFPVTVLDVRQFLSRMMLRTTLQPGLYSVYAQLLSFTGDELYFVREPALVGRTFGEALLAYPDTSPVGLKTADAAVLHPDLDTVIGPRDQLVVITRDDDTARVGPVAEADEASIIASGPPRTSDGSGPSRWLFVGWSSTLSDMLGELAGYSTGPVDIEIVCRHDDLVRVTDSDTCRPGMVVTVTTWPDHVDAASMLQERNLPSFDYVVIFNQRNEGVTHDNSTLMVMLQATAILQSRPRDSRPAVVTELIEGRLRKLCKSEAGDIVVDSEMVALMTAQLGENPELLPILVDLCDADGSEIYLKDVGAYVRPGPMSYATLVEAARRRGEIAIGYRRGAEAGDSAANFGAELNLDKNTVIDVRPGDQVIVIAADQF